jgi:mannose-6-phosphate isomerase-like protein (cupin superfamily)
MYTKTIGLRESLIKPPESKKLKSGCVVLQQGECVGEHCTDGKEEVLIILKGTATIEVEGKKTIVSMNTLAFIPEGKIHNVWNTSKEELQYIYIVSPV